MATEPCRYSPFDRHMQSNAAYRRPVLATSRDGQFVYPACKFPHIARMGCSVFCIGLDEVASSPLAVCELPKTSVATTVDRKIGHDICFFIGPRMSCGSILIWELENACHGHSPKLGDNSSACSTRPEYLSRGLASCKHHTLQAFAPERA